MTSPNALQIWYGLPGAGKSTMLARLKASGVKVFDDFMAESIRHQRGFLYSQYLGDIVAALRRSEPCAIADIRLCQQSFRDEVAAELAALVPGLVIAWHCFDCRTAEAVAICRDNVRFRAETNATSEEHAFKSIDVFAPQFTVAEGALLYPVVDARKGS